MVLDAILQLLLDLMAAVGPPGAAVAVALENLFPPIPSEPVLALAGVAAGRGSFTVVEAVIWCTVGSVSGAWALYWLGRLLGLERLRRVADRLPLIRVSDIDRTQAWFDRHGGKAVLFGRVVPLFRSFISIPAGVTKMPFWRFTLLTAAGSGVWNTAFIAAGFLLGENWESILGVMDIVQWVVLAAVVIAIGWFVWKRLGERRARATPAQQ